MVRRFAEIERLIEIGHLIRAVVELRALMDEAPFWPDPEGEPDARRAYLKIVEHFADRGISEAELNISLDA
jgi:hypothetical protein